MLLGHRHRPIPAPSRERPLPPHAIALLIALFLAFGLDLSGSVRPGPMPIRRGPLSRPARRRSGCWRWRRSRSLVGRAVASRVARLRPPSPWSGGPTRWASARRLLSLVVYGAILYGLELAAGRPLGVRPGRHGPGRRRADPAAVLARAGRWAGGGSTRPSGPCGRRRRRPVGLGRYLALKARQSLGLVLPGGRPLRARARTWSTGSWPAGGRRAPGTTW